MKLSDYVVHFLVSNKITHVFEVCGGAITHLLDSLYKRKDIRTVSMHHEQAAAFAAEGYSRSSKKTGVAIATSGPGATNLLTGISSCFFDSVPCLFITGQVNTYEFKFGRPIRQAGFQEADIVSIVKPVVKNAILVTEPDKIRYYLEKSLYIATSGRPGPVLIDIPMNIQRANIDLQSIPSFGKEKESGADTGLNQSVLSKISRLIKLSSRPVVLVGGGTRISGGQDELLKFIKKTGFPVVASLMGVDAFPHDREEFVGMIGTYGNRCANLAVANSDLLLVLGSRLDTRQTGTRHESFARAAKIIRVDIDRRELRFSNINSEFTVNCDIKKFLFNLNRNIIKYDRHKISDWKKTIKGYKDRYSFHINTSSRNIEPGCFLAELSEFLPDDAIICVDVGQNQMWAAQTLKIKNKQRFITQGGMGSMGSSLAMAIGASFANPAKNIVVITGDGGFQLNIQELQTLYHHKLPIKIIMLNNHCYGMVRQFQEQYFNSRFQSTVIGYSCPNFQDVVNAYGITARIIYRKSAMKKALKKMFMEKGPAFLEVAIDSSINVIPKLAVNKPIEDQEPPLSREELKANMVIDILQE